MSSRQDKGKAVKAEAAAMPSQQDKDKEVDVCVIVRCRPLSQHEVQSNTPQVVTCNDLQREVTVTQSTAGKKIDTVFVFDKVFGTSLNQVNFYEQAIDPLIEEVMKGLNCTILASGQCGSGKTYTIEGQCKRVQSALKAQLLAHAGIIPRAAKQIFDILGRQKANYSIKVTFLELFNEEMTDLLAPEETFKAARKGQKEKSLALMVDEKGGVVVTGLTEVMFSSATDIFPILERGSAKRLSHAHSVCSITIYVKDATKGVNIKFGKLNMVDLAGFDYAMPPMEGQERDSALINKSLLTLNCALTSLAGKFGHVPYRDSKLTTLLSELSGSRTKICIIATISPSVQCLEQTLITLSTFDYLQRAKSMKNSLEAMPNQIELANKQVNDLKAKYNFELESLGSLSKKIETTKKQTDDTSTCSSSAEPIMLTEFAEANQFVKLKKLIDGGDCLIATKIGSDILCSAYNEVISSFEAGLSWGGRFGEKNLVVCNGNFVKINVNPSCDSSVDNLLRDLRKLNSYLLHRFRGNTKSKTEDALFIPHLRKLVTDPPKEYTNSEASLQKYLSILKYHFCFTNLFDLHYLVIGLVTGYFSLGTFDQMKFVNALKSAGGDLNYAKRWNWASIVKQYSCLLKVYNYKLPPASGKSGDAFLAAFLFCRHTGIHGPQNNRVKVENSNTDRTSLGAMPPNVTSDDVICEQQFEQPISSCRDP